MSVAQTHSKFRPSHRYKDLASTSETRRLSRLRLAYLRNYFVHKNVSTAQQAVLEIPGMAQRIAAHYALPREERGNPPWQSTTASLRPLKLGDRPYLKLPVEQRHVEDPNTRPLIMNLTDEGLETLYRKGAITEAEIGLYKAIYWDTNDFHHENMTSHCSIMADLACRHREELEYLSVFQALSRAPVETLRSRKPLKIDIENGFYTVPDTLFGIRKDGKVSWFAVEADRNNEHIPTLRRKLRKYRQLIASRLYSDAYGIGNLQVLIVTTNARHMRNLISDLETTTDEEDDDSLCGPRPFLFKAIPLLYEGVVAEAIDLTFLDGWSGVGRDNVSLA